MTKAPFPELIDDTLGEVIARDDGLYDLILKRRIKKPVEKVWAAITVPERLADWYGLVELEPRLGGRYVLRFEGEDYQVNGVITEFEPLRLLAHTWPGEPSEPDGLVRYELQPDGAGCRLTLSNLGVPARYARSIAGWHAFLEALPGAADGIRTKWTMAHEEEILERYRRLLPA